MTELSSYIWRRISLKRRITPGLNDFVSMFIDLPEAPRLPLPIRPDAIIFLVDFDFGLLEVNQVDLVVGLIIDDISGPSVPRNYAVREDFAKRVSMGENIKSPISTPLGEREIVTWVINSP